jgi:hypothetical protein
MIIHSPIISGSLTFADGATFTLPIGGAFTGSIAATNGVVSGSAQITPLLPTGVVSGSSQLTTDFDARYLNTGGDGIVSSSAQVTTLLPTGVVSGSSQITYTSISSIPSGIVSGSSQTINYLNSAAPGVVSGSAQTIANLPAGTISGSSQVTYANISSIPAGIVSGSSQTITNLNSAAPGVISGSSQLSGTTITNLTITNLSVVNETASVIFTSGSNRFGDFSDDTHQFTGSVQISGSFSIVGASTATSYTGIHNGTINATNGVVSGSSQVTLSSTTGGGTSAAVQFGSLGIGMAASVTTGRIDATNDIVAYSSSDIRFKENIIAIETPLDKISKIGGYTYDWKQENHIEHGYEGNDVGVIAQEIEAVLPQLVQTRENGYKAVKYDKLVALLIEGIKEQQKQINDLTSKVNSLENKI